MENVDEDASLEFKWLKKRGRGENKKVQFYESFIYDGVEYTLYDCVYMYKEGLEEPYIGKLTKIWENFDKTKKVKVQWFFRPEEISKWLGGTKTLENEILFASGEGVGLANVNPLEAIAGQCNVVCVSKDCRNPQPSDEELKAAHFIFYRTFDVQSCTILDKMDEKVGGLEIKYVFNRKEGESTSNRKEENQNTTTCSEAQQPLTECLPDKFKDDREADKVEAKERSKTLTGSDQLHDRPSKKVKPDDKKLPKEKHVELEVARDSERLKDMPCSKDETDKDEMEAKERNKTCTGSDKLHDRSLKKIKSDDKKPPKEKQVELEVGHDSERLKDMPSKKSNVDSVKSPVDGKSKHEDKLGLHVNNLKASGTSGKTEEKPNRGNGSVLLGSDKGKISAKVTDDLEGRILKKTMADGSLKVLNNKKNISGERLSVNTNGSNGKDLVATTAFSEGNSKSGVAADTLGTNKESRGEQSGESKRKLTVSKSLKVSTSTDKDEKTKYQEFVVDPKPVAESHAWFRQLPWEERLKNAYDQGTAILLHNVDPDYTSGEVEDIVYSAFTEYCDAKILQRTAVSSPHYGQALILLRTKEAAQRILVKLDAECLMLPNGRPLVGTTCPPISPRKNSKFFGHLAIDKIKLQNREMDGAVSTSHFSQPNTIEYEMAMEWCLLQSRSKKWWEMIHKQQGNELKKLKTNFVQK